MKCLTTTEMAKLRGVSVRRVQAMLKQDSNPKRRKTHFPGAYKCQCGKEWFIPLAEKPKDSDNHYK